MSISNGKPGNRRIFSSFESGNSFQTSFTAIWMTGTPSNDNVDVSGINIKFTQDNVVFKLEE